MTARALRMGMAAGAAFALLLFFGAATMLGALPEVKDTDSASDLAAKWASTVTDSGDRTSIVIGAFLVVLAALALVWFAATVRDRFALASSPLFGFAIVAAVGAAAGSVGPLAVVGGHVFAEEPLPTDGNAIWLVANTALPSLLVVFGLACAAFIATLLLSVRGALPMWLVVFGWVAVIAALLGVFFIPMALVLLWFLVAGIYGAVRPPDTPAVTP